MERGWGSEVKTDTVMPTWSFDERGSTWFRLRRGRPLTLGLCHHKEQLADDRQVNLLAGVVESQTWHTTSVLVKALMYFCTRPDVLVSKT